MSLLQICKLGGKTLEEAGYNHDQIELVLKNLNVQVASNDEIWFSRVKELMPSKKSGR